MGSCQSPSFSNSRPPTWASWRWRECSRWRWWLWSFYYFLNPELVSSGHKGPFISYVGNRRRSFGLSFINDVLGGSSSLPMVPVFILVKFWGDGFLSPFKCPKVLVWPYSVWACRSLLNWPARLPIWDKDVEIRVELRWYGYRMWIRWVVFLGDIWICIVFPLREERTPSGWCCKWIPRPSCQALWSSYINYTQTNEMQVINIFTNKSIKYDSLTAGKWFQAENFHIEI